MSKPLVALCLMLTTIAPLRAADPVLIVLNKHEDTMSFVNPRTLETIARIPLGHDPHELVITPDRRCAYVSNYAEPGNTISVIDLVERRHVLQIPTGDFVRIHGAAISPDGQALYFTAGQSGFVVEIDPRENRLIRAIPTHGQISHMVEVSPDGERIYTANIETRNVSVIDRRSGRLIAQVACDKGCEGMSFTPDGRYLWVGNLEAGNITIIDAARNRAIETVPCPGAPMRIRFTRDGRLALVTNWVNQGELVVIDVPTRRELKRLRLGNQPIGILITPEQDRAFVTSMSSNEAHVIDLRRLEIIGRFEPGKGCDSMAWWVPPETGRSSTAPAPRVLFNGNDLTAFDTWLKERGLNADPRSVFSIREGLLRISGEEWGGLITREEFADYLLTVEYRWGEKTWPPRTDAARDSGIIVHSVGDPGAYSGHWMYGIECQIIEGGTGDFIVVGDATAKYTLTSRAKARDGGHVYDLEGAPVTLNGRGRIDWFGRDPGWTDTRGFRGRADLEKAAGAWNRLDCIVQGDAIWVVVNGTLANWCEKVRPSRGKIQIQSESAEIFFRRIDVVPYAAPPRVRRGSAGGS